MKGIVIRPWVGGESSQVFESLTVSHKKGREATAPRPLPGFSYALTTLSLIQGPCSQVPADGL